MQIVQTLNDFIKILYTPSLENLYLGDFLLVQEAAARYLGQVIELEDDKFDDSKSLAKIKLTHSINETGEIIDFNNSLPSKQCEILYANLREIVDFVNENQKTIKFGEDFKFSQPFEINLNFFKNNPLIFCDTIKEHNLISTHLAKRLSNFRKVVLFDYTGALEIEGAQRFSAKIDFKLPLDFYSLDYIWEKGLSNATLETQAICEEIFNEVKNYARVTKDKYIPFNKFVRVIQKQYKATPIQELLVLRNRLRSYQQDEIFANAKSEFTKFFEEINKEKITIIDLSNLKTFWHKDFTEFILRNLKINSFVFARLNEANFDYDLLHLFYGKDKKYAVIPSISNTFSKLPAISEYCQNYIILPTIALKKDFGYINNAVCTMAKDTVMFFGKDTKNFAFLLKNTGKQYEEKKATAAKKQTPRVTFEGDVIKNIRAKDKLTQLTQKKMKEIEQEVDQFISSGITFEKPLQSAEEMLLKPAAPSQIELEAEAGVEQVEIEIPPQTELEVETLEQEDELSPEIIEIAEQIEEYEEYEQYQPQINAGFQIEEIISEEELDLIDATQFAQKELTPEEEAFESIVQSGFGAEIEQEAAVEITQEEILAKEPLMLEPTPEEAAPEEPVLEESAASQEIVTPKEAILEETSATEEIVIPKEAARAEETQETAQEAPLMQVGEEIEGILLGEIEEEVKEELAKVSSTEELAKAPPEEEGKETEEEFENLSLEDLAAASVENAFDEAVQITFEGTEDKTTAPGEEIAEIIKPEKQKVKAAEYIEEIPIYIPETEVEAKASGENAENVSYAENDLVFHDKYGDGKVLQVVEYADKVLLQIEFERIGKRLLDPVVAGLRKIRS